ncbi:uncharacterized protein LOC123194949 [Mangifera indica]|uniref:uncharacterized protein LOC123194949 n=1 Tax=Mangifera indica TaxID=29780 RepID=UPI001CFAB6BC|nr:uncharacterized protein LOC123194949 [Mangifera indica]
MASHMVLGLVDILRDALKIFYRNRKLMASFTLITLSLFSLLYLFNIFSMKPLLTKWITDQSRLLFTSPNTPEYANLLVAAHKDMRVFIAFYGYVAVVWTLVLVVSVLEESYGIEALEKAAILLKAWKCTDFSLILQSQFFFVLC